MKGWRKYKHFCLVLHSISVYNTYIYICTHIALYGILVELLCLPVRTTRVLRIEESSYKLRFHFVQFRLHIDTFLDNCRHVPQDLRSDQ